MQRLLTVAACLFAVGAIGFVHAPPVAELAALSPWGIGVVFGTLTLAVLAGELCRFFKLPRIMGYAVIALVARPLNAGLLGAGPEAAEFFHQWEAPFAAATLLTGLSIGLALNTDVLRNHLRAVAAHTIAHLVIVSTATFVGVWGISRGFGPLDSTEIGPMLVVALLAATSGLTAIQAVNLDMHAEGRFPEMQVFVATAKNAIVVVAAAVLVTAIGVDFVPARLDAVSIVQQHGPVAAMTAAAGLGLGLLLLAVLRVASNQIVVVTFSVAIIAALVWPHEPTGTFAAGLIAGAMIANGSRLGFHLADSLGRSNPFFISVAIVFGLVEAHIPLEAEVWGFAAALFAIRGIAAYLASRAAGALARGVGGQHFAYSLLSQSLVALFLFQAISNAVPAAAVVGSYVVPLVLLNLMAGSLLHQIAIVRCGVATEVDSNDQLGFIVHQAARQDGRQRTKLDDPRSLLPPPELLDPNFRSEPLNRIVDRLRSRAIRAQDNLARDYFEPRHEFVLDVLADARSRLQEHVYETFQELRETADPERRRRDMRNFRSDLDAELLELILTFGPSHEPGKLHRSLSEFVREMERACQVDVHVRAPEEDITREPDPHDDKVTRVRKAIHAMNTRFGPRPIRTIPVRALALHHLGPGLPTHLEPAVRLDGRFRVFLWQRIVNLYHRIDDLYAQTLVHLDGDVSAAINNTGPVFDLDAVARESEELAAFEQRLHDIDVDQATLDEDSGTTVVPMLAADESYVDDRVLNAWAELLESFSTDFDDIEQSVLHFEADVRRRVALALDPAYDAFLHDLARAGTYALPARQIEAPPHGQLDALGHEIEHWKTLARSFVDRRTMLLAFRHLETSLRELLDAFIDRVETELSSHLTYYPAEISERCDDVVAALRQTFSVETSDADLSDAFVQIRHNLSDFLQEEALASVQSMRESNLFGHLMREFTDQLHRLVVEQRQSFTVVEEAYLDRPETASALDVHTTSIGFQDVLERHFVQATVASFNEISMRVNNAVDTVASGLGEINRVISFNLDAALNELRVENPQEVNRALISEFTVGGIRRAGEQASELLDVVQGEVDGIDDAILDRTVEHLRLVRRYLFDESMGRLERLAFEVDKDRSQLQQQGFALLRGLRSSASDVLEKAARPARVVADVARERFHLRETGRDELVEDVGLATFEAANLRRIPLVYRRLFTPTPVEIPELFVSRDEARHRVQAALRRWHQGRRVSIVITGDLGAGKTSFLHRAVADQLSGTKLLRWNVRERITDEATLLAEICKQFGVRRTTSVDQVLGSLRDLRGRRVVVVDGIERLFLRTMFGRDALRTFLSIVAQSPPELLWLITCNSTLWAYLETMVVAQDSFTDHIEVDGLDRRDLERLIMRRHRVSGYSLQFDLDEAESLTPSRFSGGQQRRLQKRYFDRLAEATDGHPLLSLYYWLASLRVSEETDEVSVAPLKPLRTDYLRHLGDDKLIALGQLLLHEQLSEKGFAEVMRISRDTAQRDLAFFESLNLVVREPGRRFHYRINDVLYHDVERALQTRNIV